MSNFVYLQDITTVTSSKMAEIFVVHKDDTLDEIEYCLGLKRGEIDKFWHTSSLKAEVHSDMVELFRRGQWTLVPSVSTLKVMHDLFKGNHAKGTHKRTRFTDVIPELLPESLPCSGAFIRISLQRLSNSTLSGREHLHSVEENIRIIHDTYLLLGRVFYLSFLGNTRAKDFPGRRIPSIWREIRSGK
ncbi:hypothetical protein CPB85DRAFT_749787 [Mucidula mucida]|nr:hypothetical protein CPB85DRAFT_749787 [Mucidula mucida]